jgi:hypothetical protein
MQILVMKSKLLKNSLKKKKNHSGGSQPYKIFHYRIKQITINLYSQNLCSLDTDYRTLNIFSIEFLCNPEIWVILLFKRLIKVG